MERIMTGEEKIRRAEELYRRRANSTGVRVSPTSLSGKPTNTKIIKKMVIQLLICGLIYLGFYTITNRAYIFSEEFINQSRSVLSYSVDFQKIYDDVKGFFNTPAGAVTEDQNNIVEEQNTVEENTNTVNEIANTVYKEEILSISDRNENVRTLSQMEIDANEIKAGYSLTLPFKGTITSRFGLREPTSVVTSDHRGIDIAANTGTVFIASMTGTVIKATNDADWGNYIRIRNGDVDTIYAHCHKLYVKEGDQVTQGQKIGEIGSTRTLYRITPTFSN